MSRSNPSYTLERFYFINIKPMWFYFWHEHPAFWCICGYLFFEYFRPQSIYPMIDFLPWTKLFLVLSLVLSVVDGKAQAKFSASHFILLLLTLWVFLSYSYAYDKAFYQAHIIDYLQWPIIFIAITRVVSTKERFYVFLMIFFVCNLKLSIGTAKIWLMSGFANMGGNLNGPAGFFQNSGELAIEMLIMFGLSLGLYKAYFNNEPRFGKFIILLAIGTSIATLIGAGSRGSQIALIFMVLIWFRSALLKPTQLILGATIILIVWLNFPEAQKARFSTIGTDRPSLQRQLYWQNGYEIIRSHPIGGVGFYGYIPYYYDHFPDDMLYASVGLPHNIFIQVGTDLGLVGLLLYCALILAPLLKTRPYFAAHAKGSAPIRVIRPILAGLNYGFVGFLVAGQFVSVVYYPYMWIYLALTVSATGAFPLPSGRAR